MFIAYINYKQESDIKVKENNKLRWINVKDAVVNPNQYNIPSEMKITLEKFNVLTNCQNPLNNYEKNYKH